METIKKKNMAVKRKYTRMYNFMSFKIIRLKKKHGFKI